MTDDEILKEALKRFDASESAYSDWRVLATQDLRFCSDEQWESQSRGLRESTGRPAFSADRIAPAIRQIVNESRQNRPSIMVSARGDGADEDTAHVIAGLIRDVEYQSNADAAYDTAEEYAIKCGMGYFRLVPEYEDSESFDQVLRIKVIDDPMMVYPDPDHRECDGSDQEFCFIVKNMTKDAYKRAYGESKLASINSWKGRDLTYSGWVQPDTVRVAEYFYKEYTKKTLYHVALFIPNAAGELQFFKEDIMQDKPSKEDLDSQKIVILNSRTADEVQIKWAVLNGHEVISSTDFPGQYVPVFIVKGEDFWVDGKRIIMGAVRRAKDTQRIINFMLSNQVEAIDLAIKTPFVGAAGQFDTFEEKWRTSNQQNYAYLEYNQVDVDGKQAPPPQRQNAEVPIQAIAATRLQSDDDLKAIFGVTEAAQEAAQNEVSGVAIKARQKQASASSFHFYDNLVRALKQLGRVMVDALPTYYDTPRTVRIVKPDGQQEILAINTYISAKDKKFDLTAGKYAVVVRTGPTFATKRDELVKSGIGLITQYPAAGPLIADLLVSASDFDGNQEIAARLRTQVPPEVLAATGEDGQVQGDPKKAVAALQTKLSQQQKNLEALNAHAAECEKMLKDAQEELKLERLKKDIELRKIELQYQIDNQKLQIEEATLELNWQDSTQKNTLANRQLDIQEAGMQVKAIDTAAKMMKDGTNPEKTITTISDIKPLPAIDVSGIAGDKDFTNNLDA